MQIWKIPSNWYIDLETSLVDGILSWKPGCMATDQPRFQARRPSCLFTSELNLKQRTNVWRLIDESSHNHHQLDYRKGCRNVSQYQ